MASTGTAFFRVQMTTRKPRSIYSETPAQLVNTLTSISDLESLSIGSVSALQVLAEKFTLDPQGQA